MPRKIKLQGTKVTVPARLSYAALFEPKGFNGQEPKYSVSLIIPKDDKEALAAIKEGINQAKEEGKDRAFNGKIPANLRTPVRDGDEERPDDEAYVNAYFLNANSKKAPKLYMPVKGVEPTEEDLYSGVIANVVLNFFAYNTSGNKGIGAGLMAVQFVEHGERLGGGGITDSDLDFDEAEDDDGMPF